MVRWMTGLGMRLGVDEVGGEQVVEEEEQTGLRMRLGAESGWRSRRSLSAHGLPLLCKHTPESQGGLPLECKHPWLKL